MNNSENIQEKLWGEGIKTFITNGRINEAIKILVELDIVTKNPELKSQIVLFESRYNLNEKSNELGIIKKDDYDVERNKIIYGLLRIIDDVDFSIIKMPKVLIVNFSSEAKLKNQLQKLEKDLRAHSNSNKFSLEILTISDFDDLTKKLQELKPHILHFIGDCCDDNKETVIINGAFVPNSVFADVFKTHKDTLKWVFLDSFYSETLANMIKVYIPNVIGLRIHDDMALKFVRNFYQSFADGKRISIAFEIANKSLCGCIEKDHALDV